MMKTLTMAYWVGLSVLFGTTACIPVEERPLPPPELKERNAALIEVEKELKNLESATTAQAASLLAHSDHRVRIGAARRLGAIKTEEPSAISALEQALDDPHRRVRIEAAMALGKIGGDSALNVLIRAIVDGDSKVRLWASKGLVRAKETSVPLLIQHLSKDSPLAKLGYKDTVKKPHTLRDEIVNCLTQIGKPAVPFLKSALAESDKDIRDDAATILGNIGANAETAISELLALTRSNVASSTRQKAVAAIGKIGDVDPMVTPTLLKLKKDPDENVVKAASDALKKLKVKGDDESES